MNVAERIEAKQAQIKQINRRMSARGLTGGDREEMQRSLAVLRRQIAMLQEDARSPAALKR